MVIAGNVAGCATLAVAADPMVQKLAMRDGVVDFVVTSLDEALRIFKNEIRRRNAVAVSVTAEPDAVEREMLERGVLPDLLFAGQREEPQEVCHFGPGEQEVLADTPDAGVAWINWQVERAPAQWMQRLDAIAIECLAEDRRASRWIRLGPRYFGRAAQAQRALYCDALAANEIRPAFPGGSWERRNWNGGFDGPSDSRRDQGFPVHSCGRGVGWSLKSAVEWTSSKAKADSSLTTPEPTPKSSIALWGPWYVRAPSAQNDTA